MQRTAVLEILQRFAAANTSFSALCKTPLSDASQKFEILSKVAEITGRPISNVELNNTQCLGDVLKLVDRPPAVNVLRERKRTIQEDLENIDLPPNMHFVQSKHDLIEKILQSRKESA